MKRKPTPVFMREFWQLDMFGLRATVSRKTFKGSWAPAGYEEPPAPSPFRRRSSRPEVRR